MDSDSPGAALRANRRRHLRQRLTEAIELADHDLLDLARSRAAEQEVLDLLDETTTR